MNKKQFELSAAFYKTLSEIKLSTGRDIRSELCLDGEVSLWDVAASYLVLYRFPLCFSKYISVWDRFNAWKNAFLRPYRGVAANLKDSIDLWRAKKRRGNIVATDTQSQLIFLGFVPNFYRDVLHPVAEQLTQDYDMDITVIAQKDHAIFKEISDKKITFQPILNCWNSQVQKRSRDMLRRLSRRKKYFLKEVCEKLSMIDSIDDLAKYILKREFKWLFWREFKRFILQIEMAKTILDNIKPQLIISADDADPRCRIYSFLAKKRGIPTLLIQQGLSSRNYPEWSFFSQSIVAAMGHSSGEDMIAQGVDPDKIVVTGNPGFDRLTKTDPKLIADIRRGVGLKDGQKFILFASQPHYVGVFKSAAIRREMIKAVIEGVSRVANTKLIIKPHPGEKVKELRKLSCDRSDVILLDKTTDISTLVRMCDVLITFHSTVALEALYINKPVINVNFPNSEVEEIYECSGTTWVARSVDDIAYHLGKLTDSNLNDTLAIHGNVRQKFLNNITYLPDGRATQRVVRLALNMM